MFQHNISKNSVLSNEVSLIISNDVLDNNRDIGDAGLSGSNSPSAFTVTLPSGINRVNKIRIDSITFPHINNIHTDNIVFKYVIEYNFTGQFGSNPFSVNVLDAGPINNENDLITRIPNVDFIDNVYNNKYILKFPEATLVRLPFNNLTKQIGFNSLSLSKNLWISLTDIYSSNFIDKRVTLTSLNNKFLYRKSDPTISFPDPFYEITSIEIPTGTYDIFTLLNIMKKNINIILSTTFIPETNKILIEADGNYEVLNSALAVDILKIAVGPVPFSPPPPFPQLDPESLYNVSIDENKTFPYCIADDNSNIDVSTIKDYTKLSIILFDGDVTPADFIIPEGKYTPEEIVNALNATTTSQSTNVMFNYNPITAKITANLQFYRLLQTGLSDILGGCLLYRPGSRNRICKY